jgi:SAM-dependent methyltransferase
LSFKGIKEYYSKTYFGLQKEVDIKETDKLLKCLDSDLCGKIILDVGSGPGVTLKPFCEKNYVIGIDILVEYCEAARQNGFKDTICTNVEKGLPFPDNHFDIVVCTDVFEHIFNTEYLGREINRVLKNDGYALLNVPNHNALVNRILFLLGKGIRMHNNIEDWNYFHIRFFTWKSWLKFLTICGFKVTEIYHYPTGIPIIKGIKWKPFPQFIVNKLPNLLSRRFLVKVIKKV